MIDAGLGPRNKRIYGSGATKCTSFAECMTLLKNNKDIDYDGYSGPLEFSDPGEPTSATYIISELQEDGTMKPLRAVTVGR